MKQWKNNHLPRICSSRNLSMGQHWKVIGLINIWFCCLRTASIYSISQYDYLFLFDHSCGHDKQSEDGLNVENMSKSFGGQQAKMRPTTMKQENGYLGTNPRILNPGDIQFMVFQTGDTGPFWMTEQHQEAQQKDQVVEGWNTKRKFWKAELIKKLKDHGVTATCTINDIQKNVSNQGIHVEEEGAKIIIAWEGKAKGLLQVLWEQGFINANNIAWSIWWGILLSFIRRKQCYKQWEGPLTFWLIALQSVIVNWLVKASNIHGVVAKRHIISCQ